MFRQLIKCFCLVACFLAANKGYSQSPESGNFLSSMYEEMVYQVSLNDYSSMGYTDTKTGEILFNFSESAVLYKLGGGIGKVHDTTYTLNVKQRQKLDIDYNPKFHVYIYELVPNSLDIRFIEVMVDKSDWNAAGIRLYMDYLEGNPQKILSFITFKSYD